MVNFIFERAPYLEALTRALYWRVDFVHRMAGRFKPKSGGKPKKSIEHTGTLDDVVAELHKHGLKDGDILVVHSSFGRIKPFESSRTKIVDALYQATGPAGTLVMPAFPKYAEAIEGPERLTADMTNKIFKYDVKKTPPWTGLLPFTLMRDADSVRSTFPLNTVVAKGAEAAKMLEGEEKLNLATPCGPKSPWAYCAKRDALIVAVGVDLTHSLTMIHVAEDCNEEEWPVKDWYRNRKFKIVSNGSEREMTVRERHPKWASNYAERRLSYDLRRLGLSKTSVVKGLEVTSIRSSTLIKYLESRRKTGYPYYLWSVFK